MQSLFSIKLKRKAKKYFSQGLLVKEKDNQMQNFKSLWEIIALYRNENQPESTANQNNFHWGITDWCKKISHSVFVVPGTNELNK